MNSPDGPRALPLLLLLAALRASAAYLGIAVPPAPAGAAPTAPVPVRRLPRRQGVR